MSSFGGKRKARVIKVVDEDDGSEKPSPALNEEPRNDELPRPSFNSKNARKPFRQSGLRKTFNLEDDDGGANLSRTGAGSDDDDDRPRLVRPNISRPGSVKNKTKQPKASRLSFGGDDRETGEDAELVTPKKVTMGQRVLENSAARRGLATRGLPLRSVEDDDRPRYSKEYLDELQSSTPNTPPDITSLRTDDVDDMDLDLSELDGALVVDSPGVELSKPDTTILSNSEIQERKERRARLAQEEGFISVEEDDEDYSLGRKKKDDTRLIAEDEDLGEGFDSFVDDGGLSLGKRAEKERRKHDRQQMAELITAAEGHTSDSSSDSDAERRIAYEAAQTRAGMDGLKKPRKHPAEDLLQVPPKITPLPSLSECMARLQSSLRSMEEEIKSKGARVESLRKEKDEITQREAEVQALLDETGKKYQEVMNRGKGSAENIAANAIGPAAELALERGLESWGTPRRRSSEDEEIL